MANNKFRNFGFGLKLLKARLLKQYFPFHVLFFVTKNCNFRCNYCYGRFYTKQKEMPLDKIKYVIDELARAGTRRVCLLGGEPLIRDDIGDIINYSKLKKIDTTMNTNGSLIKKRIHEIKHLDHIYVSLDGRKEGNDANRGAGTYEKAIEGIEIALHNGIPVGIVSVMTKNNINELEYLVDLCSKKRLSLYLYTAMNQVSDSGYIPIPSLPTTEEYKEMIKNIIKYIEKNAPIRYTKEVYRASLNWIDYSRDCYLHTPPDFDYIKCYAGKYTCSIDADGNVFPCVRECGIDKPGNIFKDGFKQAWRIVNGNYCKACHMECVNEMNLFFSLNIKIMINFIRLTLNRERK